MTDNKAVSKKFPTDVPMQPVLDNLATQVGILTKELMIRDQTILQLKELLKEMGYED